MTQDDAGRRSMHRFRGKGHVVTGALLATLGMFWLAHKLGWLPGHGSGPAIFWPMLLVGVGLFIVFGSGHRQNRNSE